MEITLLNGHTLDTKDLITYFTILHTRKSIKEECNIFGTYNRSIRREYTMQLAKGYLWEIRYLYREGTNCNYRSVFFKSKEERDNYYQQLKNKYNGLQGRNLASHTCI